MRSNFTVMRTAPNKKKGSKSAKKGKTTPKSKKSVPKIRPGWNIDDYRDAHKPIPGKIYSTKGTKSTKTVEKTNYAPLGRPPENVDNRIKYNEAKARLTPHGEKVARKQIRNMRVERATQDEWLKYLKQSDRYEDMLAEEGNLIKGMRADEIYTELEDRGYSDTRKGWKRMSKKNQAKALYEEQYREWKTYNDY